MGVLVAFFVFFGLLLPITLFIENTKIGNKFGNWLEDKFLSDVHN